MKKIAIFAVALMVVAAATLAFSGQAQAAGCGCGGANKCKATCGQAGQTCGGNAAVKAAIQAKDFEAWKKAMADKPCPNKPALTREVFDQLVKASESGQGTGGACHLKKQGKAGAKPGLGLRSAHQLAKR
jgi:hypothetical protein